MTAMMSPLPPRTSARSRGASLQAIAVGALLAAGCWGMARHGDPQVVQAGYAGVFAFVMVCAGAAAFVLHALHVDGQGRALNAAVASYVVRRLTLRLGVSFVGALHLLNTYLPA